MCDATIACSVSPSMDLSVHAAGVYAACAVPGINQNRTDGDAVQSIKQTNNNNNSAINGKFLSRHKLWICSVRLHFEPFILFHAIRRFGWLTGWMLIYVRPFTHFAIYAVLLVARRPLLRHTFAILIHLVPLNYSRNRICVAANTHHSMTTSNHAKHAEITRWTI